MISKDGIGAVGLVVGIAVGTLYGGIFVVLPLLLATWQWMKRRNTKQFIHSKFCVGQVWHTRFHPKRHAFTYPIFMFALDLEDSFGNFLWPIVRFRPTKYHLKNGEGQITGDDSLAQRILQLVATKTQDKFQPTLMTHQIILLTHLEYYGYNFNPVSFYYIINKTTRVMDAMVGEVSNTPWTEMYCYVLHPQSIDQVQCRINNKTEKSSRTLDYRFPKNFHVSPFMEMEYWYDWMFQGSPGAKEEFVVVNSLRRRSKEETMDFTAKLKLVPQPITPMAVAWQMIRFPIFCMMIQIWIHYQAAWLFLKGIVYVPHPKGSETVASRTIATIMIPFFAIRDYLQPKSKTA